VPETISQSIIDIAQSFNIDARITGHCEAAEQNKVTLKGEFGEVVYA
jgi:hypothetical protein